MARLEILAMKLFSSNLWLFIMLIITYVNDSRFMAELNSLEDGLRSAIFDTMHGQLIPNKAIAVDSYCYYGIFKNTLKADNNKKICFFVQRPGNSKLSILSDDMVKTFEELYTFRLEDPWVTEKIRTIFPKNRLDVRMTFHLNFNVWQQILKIFRFLEKKGCKNIETKLVKKTTIPLNSRQDLVRLKVKGIVSMDNVVEISGRTFRQIDNKVSLFLRSTLLLGMSKYIDDDDLLDYLSNKLLEFLYSNSILKVKLSPDDYPDIIKILTQGISWKDPESINNYLPKGIRIFSYGFTLSKVRGSSLEHLFNMHAVSSFILANGGDTYVVSETK